MRISAGVVPGFFTMSNMFCGFLSAIMSAQGRFIPAAWLIIAAGVLDILDGKLARLTESDSHFGIQYDSMADVISFGLAPSCLVYFIFFRNWDTIGVIVSFIPLVFGAIRLARFNITTKGPAAYFTGLPIPAAAAAIATFIIFNLHFWGILRWSKVLLSLMLVTALLMISNIPFDKIPLFKRGAGRQNKINIIILLSSMTIVSIFPQETIFPVALLYLLTGPLRALWRLLSERGQQNETEPLAAKENEE